MIDSEPIATLGYKAMITSSKWLDFTVNGWKLCQTSKTEPFAKVVNG